MFTKATLLGTLVGGIVMNLLGWVFYEYAAASFFEAHTLTAMDAHMDPVYITIGALIIAFAMSNIYKRYTSHYGVGSGFKFGVWIGVLFGFGMGLVMYGTAQWMDITATIVDNLWALLYYGITGASIGWVFSKTHSSKTA